MFDVHTITQFFSSDAFRLGKHVISNHLVKPALHIISHLMQFFGVGFTDDDAKKLSWQQYFDKGDFVGYFITTKS